jgi:hypothetical protein
MSGSGSDSEEARAGVRGLYPDSSDSESDGNGGRRRRGRGRPMTISTSTPTPTPSVTTTSSTASSERKATMSNDMNNDMNDNDVTGNDGIATRVAYHVATKHVKHDPSSSTSAAATTTIEGDNKDKDGFPLCIVEERSRGIAFQLWPAGISYYYMYMYIMNVLYV